MFILKEGGGYFVFYPFCGLFEFFLQDIKETAILVASRISWVWECVCDILSNGVARTKDVWN